MKLFYNILLGLFLALSCYSQDVQELTLYAPQSQNIIKHQYYIVSYNADKKNPDWTIYRLTREMSINNVIHRFNKKFVQDPLCSMIQADNSDYGNSGFDKGHMVNFDDMAWDKTAGQETFYFTNCAPQYPACNRGTWKIVENHIRKLAESGKDLIIISGTIYTDNQRIGSVAIPSAFFKIIYYDNQATGYIVSNNKYFLGVRGAEVFEVSIKEINRQTGFKFRE